MALLASAETMLLRLAGPKHVDGLRPDVGVVWKDRADAWFNQLLLIT